MDATPVGMVRPSLYLPDGYVLANGATVKRADYPRLVALADAQSLWTDDTAANLGLYGKGDGTTTMVLPNWVGRMAQYASAAGGTVAAGLPNITGSFIVGRKEWYAILQTASGAFGFGEKSNYAALKDEIGLFEENYFDTLFDAGKSNAIYGNSTTVQPPAINVLPILRY